MTNRGYYTLSNFSGNKPQAVVDVRRRPTYTTCPERSEEICEENVVRSNRSEHSLVDSVHTSVNALQLLLGHFQLHISGRNLDM